jgi:hypothetical protein
MKQDQSQPAPTHTATMNNHQNSPPCEPTNQSMKMAINPPKAIVPNRMKPGFVLVYWRKRSRSVGMAPNVPVQRPAVRGNRLSDAKLKFQAKPRFLREPLASLALELPVLIKQNGK